MSQPSDRFYSKDHRQLTKEEYQKRVKVNPYIDEIYQYEEILLAHPTPAKFTPYWEKLATFVALHIEIGCGSGRYLLQLAKKFPHEAFLGMELRYKRTVLAARKIIQQGMENVFFLRERGEYLVDYFPHNSLDSIHINFPDPWAKKKQKKNRLLQPKFFATSWDVLKKEGKIFFKTDHIEYFQTVVAFVKTFPHYEILEFSDDLHQSIYMENNIMTEFELLFQSKHNPKIGYLQIQKVESNSQFDSHS